MFNTTLLSLLLIVTGDPCKDVRCPTGSQCEVYKPSGETYCNPSCDVDNGGCQAGQTCSLQEVQCVRAPCPPSVQCGQYYTLPLL